MPTEKVIAKRADIIFTSLVKSDPIAIVVNKYFATSKKTFASSFFIFHNLTYQVVYIFVNNEALRALCPGTLRDEPLKLPI